VLASRFDRRRGRLALRVDGLPMVNRSMTADAILKKYSCFSLTLATATYPCSSRIFSCQKSLSQATWQDFRAAAQLTLLAVVIAVRVVLAIELATNTASASCTITTATHRKVMVVCFVTRMTALSARISMGCCVAR